jgi:hypothetical protein
MHFINSLLLGLLLVSCAPSDRNAVATSESPDSNTQSRFDIYDALGGFKKDKPDLNGQYGFKSIYVTNETDLWGPKPVDPSNWPPVVPGSEDFLRIEKLADDLESRLSPGTLVTIDIEHWKVGGSETQSSISKLIDVLNRFLAHAPSLKYGFYYMAPIRNRDPSAQVPDSPAYKKWRLQNDALKELVDRVDVLFPSLYDDTLDVNQWSSFAVANLEEA